jgi:predicted metal-dependent HD superfamily phosphohydrolase
MNETELKEIFIQTLRKFSDNDELNDMYWREINWFYSHKHLHYHTLQHLTDMFLELVKVKIYIQNWDAILFALFYHDCHYNTSDTENEEKSAKIALQRLSEANVPEHIISLVTETILATKHHRKNFNQDINYFVDADLSILGQAKEQYLTYKDSIRKEFDQYSDAEFNFGRKMILENFLNQEKIYKTEHFNHFYEDQARENINFEIGLL